MIDLFRPRGPAECWVDRALGATGKHSWRKGNRLGLVERDGVLLDVLVDPGVAGADVVERLGVFKAKPLAQLTAAGKAELPDVSTVG